MALAGLRRYEEALIEYFKCYLLEDSCSKFLRMEIMKVFHELITTSGQEEAGDPPTLCSESDEEGEGGEEAEEGESDDVTLTRKLVKKNKKLLIAKNKRLTAVLKMIEQAVRGLVSNPPKLSPRSLDPQAAEKDDFDCSLCFRCVGVRNECKYGNMGLVMMF